MRKKKKIIVYTSYMSGHGGVERIIQRMNSIIDFKTISLFDGEFREENKSFFQKGTSLNNWIPRGNGEYYRLRIKNKILNAVLHFFIILKSVLIEKPEIIISTSPIQVFFLNVIRKILRCNFNLYAWPHFSVTSNFGEFEKFSKADYVLCISKGIVKQLKELGINESKLDYFPNPFLKVKKIREIKIRDGITKFFYIGRLQFLGQKNIKELIDAVSINKRDDFSVEIIGSGDDYDIIMAYINKKKLENKINVVNKWLDDPWEYASEYDCLLLTSKFEGLPTVIGESLSYGIPCISSDCETGPSDFIKDGVNGYLYKPGEIEELSNKITTFIENKYSFSADKVIETMDEFMVDKYEIRLKRYLYEK